MYPLLMHAGDYEEGIRKLTKAKTLSQSQKVSYANDIIMYVLRRI
jgi:hypothetical protein